MYMLPVKVVPHLEKEELEELAREESSLKQARRYLALLQAYRTNYYPDCEAIADLFLVSTQTVYNWIKAWNREGLEGIRIDKPSGRPKKLNKAEREQLIETILHSPRESGYRFSTWTLKAISNHVSREFDKEMSESGIYKMLRRNDIVQVKPRPMPAKGDPKKNANLNGA
ncbi:MAG: helix-turn-helix domain-containing protein [Candidatus Lokiarchaeota archaeon]|nr:helix-turn-helix domain-containing protein [Candidatus Lokiarchaeota archaeon]MBD3337644.1 helix-turn-helix domain-containing protein [Candidatus Lokiarchaeota archaeon]